MTDLTIPSVPPLPHPRRVITGHNPDGKAIFIKDEAVEPIFWSPESVNPVYGFYRTEETPAVIDSEISGEWVDHIAQNRKLSSPEGSTFSTIDLAPGQVVVRAPFLSLLMRFLDLFQCNIPSQCTAREASTMQS